MIHACQIKLLQWGALAGSRDMTISIYGAGCLSSCGLLFFWGFFFPAPFLHAVAIVWSDKEFTPNIEDAVLGGFFIWEPLCGKSLTPAPGIFISSLRDACTVTKNVILISAPPCRESIITPACLCESGSARWISGLTVPKSQRFELSLSFTTPNGRQRLLDNTVADCEKHPALLNKRNNEKKEKRKYMELVLNSWSAEGWKCSVNSRGMLCPIFQQERSHNR